MISLMIVRAQPFAWLPTSTLKRLKSGERGVGLRGAVALSSPTRLTPPTEAERSRRCIMQANYVADLFPTAASSNRSR